MSSSVLVVRHPKDLECKVFDIGCASWLDVDGVIWADFFFEAFEGVEKVVEKTARIEVLRSEGYAKLRGIVGACAQWSVGFPDTARWTYTSTRRWVRVPRVPRCAGGTVRWI